MGPFGAINVFRNKKDIEPITLSRKITRKLAQIEDNPFSNNNIKITFTPKKQHWHDAKHIIIKIHDPAGVPISHKINLFYNDKIINDIVGSIMESRINDENDTLILKLAKIRLPARDDHKIMVTYRRSLYEPIFHALYETPDCPLTDIQAVVNTSPFNIKKIFLKNVHDLSATNGINPSLVTALIAQESGFSTKAISWAKAVGLTQITSIAEKEIIDNHPNWPRYQNSNRLNFLEFKTLIATGKMNSKNEWRLDKYKSVQGGIDYLKYLDNFWSRAKNSNIISEVDQLKKRDVILASYNSGPTRVKRSIRSEGKNWLSHHEMSEAKKYVKRIKSYCYHFNEQ